MSKAWLRITLALPNIGKSPHAPYLIFPVVLAVVVAAGGNNQRVYST